jgi:hypothetical protein
MTDLEQQIKAWADATVDLAAEAPGVAAPPEPAVPSTRARRWARPLVVAAVAVALVGIGIVVVGRGDERRVRTGPAGPVTTTTQHGPRDARDIVAESLFAGGAGDAPIGTIGAAFTEAQFTELWGTLEPSPKSRGFGGPGPAPDLDFGHTVVLSIVVGGDGCPTEFAGFRNTSGHRIIEPVFDRPDPVGPCDREVIPIRYLIAIDWDTTYPTIVVQVPTAETGVVEQLQLRRSQPDPVVVELETDIGQVHAGDQFDVNVAIQNATGAPIDTVGCGRPFALGLRRGGELYAAGQGWCRQEFAIPTGSSVYRVTLMAGRNGCTTDPTAVVPERCLDDGSPADLEPGIYEMVLLTPEGFDALPLRRMIEVLPRDR